MSPVLAILAVPRVLAAVRLVLTSDATLVARLAPAPASVGGGSGIYTEGLVPADAKMPYLTIGPFTERSDGGMGSGIKWASELTMAIKLVSKSRDISANLTTVDRVIALLHGVPLTVADYAAASCVLDVMVAAYEELIAGTQVTHYPTMWTVRVDQRT